MSPWMGVGKVLFLPVAPRQRMFVVHFKVDIIIPFVRMAKLIAVLLSRAQREKSDPWTQSTQTKGKIVLVSLVHGQHVSCHF